MFVATIIFAPKLGPSRETCVMSHTLYGVNDRLERVKAVLKRYKLVFVGSIIEEIQGIDPVSDVLGNIQDGLTLDFVSQDGRMVH